MAWTAPALNSEFAVGEIPGSSKLNTKITDNLRYLKGLDGTIALEAGIRLITDVAFAGGEGPKFYRNAATGATIQGGTGTVTDFAFVTNAGVRLLENPTGSNDFVVDGAGVGGRFGVRAATPRGPVHVQGANGRWLWYDFSIANNTTVVVVPDGSGDASFGLQLSSIVRGSGGIVQVLNAGGSVISPGGSAALYSNGSDILTLRVLANGQIEIQRTGGTLTYVGAIWGQWI